MDSFSDPEITPCRADGRIVVAVVVKLLRRNPHFESKCVNYLSESVVVESCCWLGGGLGRYSLYLDDIQVLDESA